MTCEFHHDDGAYVLGALSPVDRQRFERHLADCDVCATAVRELAGLPGLLARVDPTVLDAPAGEVPPTLLPRLVAVVRRERRRQRWVAVGAAAAAAVVAAVGASVVVNAVTDEGGSAATAPPVGREMVPIGGTSIHGDLAMESVPWGTRLNLSCSYPDDDGGGGGAYTPAPGATYALVLRTREGVVEQVATWHSIEGGRTMQLVAATQAARDDIAWVEVRTSDGVPVLKLTA